MSSVLPMFVLLLRKNRAQVRKKIDLTLELRRMGTNLKKNYIRPHSAVDSAQWDWGIIERSNAQNLFFQLGSFKSTKTVQTLLSST